MKIIAINHRCILDFPPMYYIEIVTEKKIYKSRMYFSDERSHRRYLKTKKNIKIN